MKKLTQTKFFTVAVALLFLVSLLILNHPERKITSFVLSNQADLFEISANYLNGDSTVQTYKNVQVDGVFKDEHTIVQFFYSGFGIAPASKYYGFYYSPDNTPTTFQNSNNDLIENSNGEWEWTDGTDNGGITKRICDHWFYCEAWF